MYINAVDTARQNCFETYKKEKITYLSLEWLKSWMLIFQGLSIATMLGKFSIRNFSFQQTDHNLGKRKNVRWMQVMNERCGHTCMCDMIVSL